ncbi:DNA polymerase kappa-like isoform X2 [Uloborus diversus]|uniref:DNA polymerase kappa-like isoform X2 n=1 Tax=Uloborus diversus TaxID=327109 RepID=UPI0024095B63|nr:DNA polymerase kappa-like isoform X2 [Uloborus diversus]
METENSSSTTGLKTMQLNDQKAGMQGLNKEAINKVIYEASKGTPYFAFQEKRQRSIDSKVNELLANLKKINEFQRKDSLEKMSALGSALEAERDLTHSIVHIDMDAFYAAVEMLDDPGLKEKPMAVGSSSMLSTSNYQARKYGVRAAMPGFIAKRLCPELVIVPCNFDKYRKVSHKIRDILKTYDPDFSPASLDEAYLDLTMYIKDKYRKQLHLEYCLKKNFCEFFSDEENDPLSQSNYENCITCSQPISFEKRDEMAYDIVEEIRKQIYETTQLTASAGIAPNTMLAKVCSDQNKPNGQYQICSTVEAVKSFISTLPVKKISGIGPVQGQILNAIGIHTCADIWEKRDIVGVLFSTISVDFYIRVGLGIGSTTVKSDYVRKSIGVEHTFKDTHQRDELYKRCMDLCEEMIEDLKSRKLMGKVVVLKIKTSNFETHTRNHSLAYHTDDQEIICKAAKKLLDFEISASAPHPLTLRLMGSCTSKNLGATNCQKWTIK